MTLDKPPRSYAVTLQTLEAYQAAALANAESLLLDADALFAEKRFSRTYFLSTAALEETGKAYLAFTARGRDLTNPAVAHKVRRDFEDHSQKTNCAFAVSLLTLTPDEMRERVGDTIKLIIGLKNGREQSMYTDFRDDASIRKPDDVVTASNAGSAMRLAVRCYDETKAYLASNSPSAFTTADDKWYALGPKSNKVWQHDDFGEYLLDFITKNGAAFSMGLAVTTYFEAYLSKGRKFLDQPDK